MLPATLWERKCLRLGDSGVRCFGWSLVLENGHWVPYHAHTQVEVVVLGLASDFFKTTPSVWDHPIHPSAVTEFRRLPRKDMFCGHDDACDPPLSLYHGTSRSALQSIWKDGFRLPQCKERPGCATHGCTCHMMGPCVYFAEYGKAAHYARESSFWKGRTEGAVVRCAVFLGRWKVQPAAARCGCCGKPYVDHEGAWMRDAFWDCLFLDAESRPATREPEWCHRRPGWLTCLDFREFREGEAVKPMEPFGQALCDPLTDDLPGSDQEHASHSHSPSSSTSIPSTPPSPSSPSASSSSPSSPSASPSDDDSPRTTSPEPG